MVKVDIVRSIQLATGLNYEEVEEMITQTVEIMKESLEDGESVLVTGLGKFEVRDKRARPGRDPKSKKPYEISARRVVTFHTSKVWREEINLGY